MLKIGDSLIYIYKEESLSVCLFVLHAFGHGTSKCTEILHRISFRPEEGHRAVTWPSRDKTRDLPRGHKFRFRD